ncbi:MAG: cytochrome c oxidase subunit 4 [Candidatus Binatia bacterium]|jgi:cytochrome c oxidase subunit 4
MDASHDHGEHDFASHTRQYKIIFALLIIGTILTVAVAQFDLDAMAGMHGHNYINIIVGLLIATTKASLVMLFFMHLISEKQLIYLVLGFTFFFFAGLMGLTIWAMSDYPKLSVVFD